MKAYISPEVTEFGDASSLTGFSADSSAPDVFMFPNGDTIPGEGSLDGCIEDENQCVFE